MKKQIGTAVVDLLLSQLSLLRQVVLMRHVVDWDHGHEWSHCDLNTSGRNCRFRSMHLPLTTMTTSILS